MVTEVKLEQSSKASSPIDVTPFSNKTHFILYLYLSQGRVEPISPFPLIVRTPVTVFKLQ
jgi:hypothetical protein